MHQIEEWAARHHCAIELSHCGIGWLCVRGRPDDEAMKDLRANVAIRVHSDILA